ncbi:hypothetical protein [Candidatus Phytoplasma meliae]|uniref:Site-specific DNA-methyltransferase (adenine-specific) n=1 Tax=Candidatus Phytoplasma meliae TaxID=1848402 RepID=A0ABS5CXY5_9MOLU|nr:hypothetical protein [Candidatus Phytoplasma meliae]MBP5835830.1 hypothetical protein [Candidatus Phytoplasma meliae]
MNKKKQFGQFFTRKQSWFTKPLKEFIHDNLKENHFVLDPFAGEGDILNFLKCYFENKITNLHFVGYDIDKKFTEHKMNDSLKDIPYEKKHKYFITTNPPYLAKNSCCRKKYTQTYKDYFETTNFTDLYLLALSKMISTNQPGFAIVPETFINSKFDKTNINKIIVIESNPFEDTTTPICVVCFNGVELEKQIIYKNDDKIGSLQELKKIKTFVKEKSEFLKKIRFNDVNGVVALVGVDSTNPKEKIKFIHKKELKYNISNIKTSSRAITIIHNEEFKYLDDLEIEKIITSANQILNTFRTKTKDVLLSPFKGNNKNNQRRRRLDFHLARNILTKAFIGNCNNINGDINYETNRL